MSVIIFDFDGTIADTLNPLLAIANDMAQEFGYPLITLEQFNQLQTLDSRAIIKQSKIPVLKIPFLLRRIKADLNRQITSVQPIKGVPQALRDLKNQHHQLGIVTSNSEKNVIDFLTHHCLLDLFDFVKSGTTIFGKHRVIRRLLQHQNIDIQKTIYVGDETRDIESARAINMAIIAVSWGFNDHAVLAQYAPNQLINAPELLASAVQAVANS
ncbi:MAG: HAD hydrolase-like protein [Cyanobacteria bacterium P01_F01_bin.150]